MSDQFISVLMLKDQGLFVVSETHDDQKRHSPAGPSYTLQCKCCEFQLIDCWPCDWMFYIEHMQRHRVRAHGYEQHAGGLKLLQKSC